jgi:hypothetical protein
MNLSLSEYLKSEIPPRLSHNVKYSYLFEKQYDRLSGELLGLLKEDKGVKFFCWKSEFEEFKELAAKEKLIYKDKIVDLNLNPEFLKDYSENFEKGFNSINDQTPYSIILNHIPICLFDRCLCRESEQKNSIRIGRLNSKSRPCIAGIRAISFDSFFGQGIHRFKKIDYETNIRLLSPPEKVAFKDGIMFKSIFLVIERYVEFEEYFNDNSSLNDESKRISESRRLNVDESPTEGFALEIIGKLNFEKACDIICEGISDRMPSFLYRIKSQKELLESNQEYLDEFEGLSKEEIIKTIKQKIYAKRDSLVNAYNNLFKKIEQNSVDPDFTKEQSKRTIYTLISNHADHFKTLRQYPSDWNNENLFGELWGYSLLVMYWKEPSRIKTKNESASDSLNDLFNNPKMIEACVDVLRSVEPPLIDDSNNYIGNSKGALCVWFNEMKKLGIIKNLTDRQKYANALNNYFVGFSINSSMFAKVHKRAEEKYKREFSTMLAKIKLSQSSQV